ALRLAGEDARGDDAGAAYRYSRLEPGARAALFYGRGAHQAELGYAWAAAAQERIGDGPEVRERTYQDKAYGFWDFSFSERIHLRTLLSWEFANGHFGGGNGSFVALF